MPKVHVLETPVNKQLVAFFFLVAFGITRGKLIEDQKNTFSASAKPELFGP